LCGARLFKVGTDTHGVQDRMFLISVLLRTVCREDGMRRHLMLFHQFDEANCDKILSGTYNWSQDVSQCSPDAALSYSTFDSPMPLRPDVAFSDDGDGHDGFTPTWGMGAGYDISLDNTHGSSLGLDPVPDFVGTYDSYDDF
jgi:hypothetical protein